MRKISLSFNRKDFEYDVYSLIRAFEPGCEIVTWYEEEQEPEQVDETWDRCRVHYEPDGISFSIRWETSRSGRRRSRWNMKKTGYIRKTY